jgi:tRNA (cmo5U34)-methyltransferase
VTNQWPDAAHALAYLARADGFPHRAEGEQVLLEVLADCDVPPARVLDLGTGDGRLAAIVRAAYPDVEVVGVDFSPLMLQRFRDRFDQITGVTLVEHDLDQPLPVMDCFDAVVSSFAIHHLSDARKRALFGEVHDLLRDGGVFANLEHVASPTLELHEDFRRAMGIDHLDDDPSNQLAPVDDQLGWLGEAGFTQVDCLWKWRELALLVGCRTDAVANVR